MNAIGYLCELPGAPSTLSVEAQRSAVADACTRLGVTASVPFHDQSSDGRPVLQRLLTSGGRGARGAEPARRYLVVAQIAVLGDSVREQWARALQCAGRGLELQLADGRAPDDALMAAWDGRGAIDRRRERALDGMRRRAVRGEPLGRAPYGYRIESAAHSPTGRSRLVPDETEAPVVRRIVAWYLDGGEGVRRIAARLNADGVPTRRGGPWNMASVRDLLHNPVYTGLYRRLGVTIPGSHESLISAEDFRAVQRQLGMRRSRPPGTGRRREYPLSGLARCGYCGAALVGAGRVGSGGTELRSYRCGAASAQGRCRAHTRPADDLESAVLDEIANGTQRAPLLDPLPRAGEASDRTAAARRALDHAIERRADGEWTAEQLASRGTPLALELLTAATPLGARAPLTEAPVSIDDARTELIEGWGQLEPETRRKRLSALVREIVVTDDRIRVALVT